MSEQITIAIIGGIASIIGAAIAARITARYERNGSHAEESETPEKNRNAKRRRNTTFMSFLGVGFAITALALSLFPGRVASITGTVVPRGTIVAWTRESGEVPPGWAECNGARGTPDFRNRFLRGVATVTETGQTGGSETHRHDVFHTTQWMGEGFQAEGNRCAKGDAPAVNHLPPFFTVVYIMKL